MPLSARRALAAAVLAFSAAASAQTPNLDQTLLEIDIPHLQALYRDHKLTVTQVTQWYLDRIRRYNPVYAPIEDIAANDALATAAREDAEAQQPNFRPGPLWGVPIVIKENTSIAGRITSDGWKGYKLPGHELIAPKDATVVTKLRAAGAIILGKTNMPDFAASDTNRSTAFGRTGNAYDVRFSPGGSSGGTVTAITSNLAMLGTGTDTGNSIRMPAATSAVVGVFPTRGLVSIAGIAPLDWLLDNTGPIARNVTDAAIALTVMTSQTPDSLDPRTAEAPTHAQPGPYTKYLNANALQGKRFGVPACVLTGIGIPFQGIPASTSEADADALRKKETEPLRPETRAAFMKAVEALRAAGATIVFDDSILGDDFALTASRIGTFPYVREGTDNFLANFGPAQYHSAAEYEKAVRSTIPSTITGAATPDTHERRGQPQVHFEGNPQAEADVLQPRTKALAQFNDTLSRLHLDGYVYPATQMPPMDETMPQDNGGPNQLSTGPHSATGWVNMLGVPAIVVPAGFYANGIPFGLEISTSRWHDGDLLGYAYAFEQATHARKPPVLVDKGLVAVTP